MLTEIPKLMNQGTPVTIKFNARKTPGSPLEAKGQLYCQLVHQARYGKTSHITTQDCPVGKHVLEEPQPDIEEYYYSKKRYKTLQAAQNIIRQLPGIRTKIKNIKIAPYPQENYDLLLLYLTPEKAMKLIQALSYDAGKRTNINTAGVASICADSTAQPYNTQQTTLSLGCKGSRKHSQYKETELIATIPRNQIQQVEESLKEIPDTKE